MRTSLRSSRLRGFTMVELIIVLVVVAILAAIASPEFLSVLAAQRVRASASDLVSSMLATRSEAIKRNSTMYVFPRSSGDWRNGWTVYTSNFTPIDTRNAMGTQVAVARAPDYVMYSSAGRIANGGTLRFEIYDVDGTNDLVSKRCVTLDSSGLPRLAKGACP